MPLTAYFLSLEIALYSMITYLSASKTLDFIIEGIEEYIGVTIVAVHSEDIRKMIINNMGRGVTVYSGKRGYGKNGESKATDIIYTVITRLELNKLYTEIESAGIRFGTSNLERLKIASNGNVGIDISSPTEKLDVVENIKVSGEINRTATGSTNLLPIAFGMIQDNNTIISGSVNFTITDMGTGHKQITVNGVTLSIDTHTVVGSTFASTPRFASYLIITGELEVFTYNLSSTLVNTPFSFVISFMTNDIDVINSSLFREEKNIF
jgi:Uncharacterized protein conserved in bacteria (DUF2179)/Uncharacterised 5xTM membrane BCR, YitT family COG1284